MSKKISLKQFLMKSGRFDDASDCISAIESGMVTINNEIIKNPNYFFNSEKFLVKSGNEKLKSVRKLHFIMNKPSGYLCQKSQNEKTIYDLINNLDLPEDYKKSLHAIGRLDKETEGLLILTNDGKLSSLVTNPENKIIKKYHAVLEKPIDADKIKILEKGIEISIDDEKYKTKKCKIKAVGEKEAYISISEGRKRQIRKMFEAIGNKVAYLKRVSIGGLSLGNLKTGEIRQIEREEIVKKLNP